MLDNLVREQRLSKDLAVYGVHPSIFKADTGHGVHTNSQDESLSVEVCPWC
jgi:hypothetical protein